MATTWPRAGQIASSSSGRSPRAVAVGRDHDLVGVELVEALDPLALAELGAGLGRERGEPAHELRRLDRGVARVEDRAVEAAEGRRQVVAPLRLEAVLPQRLVLGEDLPALLLVGGEAQAAGAAERALAELHHPVEAVLGPAPQARRGGGAVGLAGHVVARGAAAERKAAVSPARALRDPPRVMHAHAQPRRGEGQRARAAGDAAADDRDVDAAVVARPRPDGRGVVEPVGPHRPILRQQDRDRLVVAGLVDVRPAVDHPVPDVEVERVGAVRRGPRAVVRLPAGRGRGHDTRDPGPDRRARRGGSRRCRRRPRAEALSPHIAPRYQLFRCPSGSLAVTSNPNFELPEVTTAHVPTAAPSWRIELITAVGQRLSIFSATVRPGSVRLPISDAAFAAE